MDCVAGPRVLLKRWYFLVSRWIYNDAKSARCRVPWRGAMVAEEPDALPPVLVIAPGSGHCGRALRRSHGLYIAADPLYDIHGRRARPHSG